MTTKPFSKNNVGGFNAISAMIASALAQVSTCSLVQVAAVYPNPDGGVLSGTVDVQPLVNQIDDNGAPTPHGTICGLPYFQLQGGASAVILTPAEGDIGVAAFATAIFHRPWKIRRHQTRIVSTIRQSGRHLFWRRGEWCGAAIHSVPIECRWHQHTVGCRIDQRKP